MLHRLRLALKARWAGQYICARPFHLGRYTDEQAYRFNVRTHKDGARFVGGLVRTAVDIRGAHDVAPVMATGAGAVLWPCLLSSQQVWSAKPCVWFYAVPH
jgi:hypothetical protein